MPFASGAFPLFVQGDAPSFAKASLPLSVHATTLSGVFSALPLFVLNNSGDNRVSGSMPLYVGGYPVPVTGTLTLYACGEPHRAAASLNLVVANSGVTGTLTLYARGEGTTPGAIPVTASLPLFLARPTTAVLNLYCQAPGTPASGSLPLYTQGAYLASGVLHLVLPSAVASLNGTLDLFTSGW